MLSCFLVALLDIIFSANIPHLPLQLLLLLLSSAQRQSLSLSLNTSIQKSLHAATADPDSLLYLLDTYSACLTHTTRTISTAGSGAAGKECAAEDFAAMSVPDLMLWVRDSACVGTTRPEVGAERMEG